MRLSNVSQRVGVIYVLRDNEEVHFPNFHLFAFMHTVSKVPRDPVNILRNLWPLSPFGNSFHSLPANTGAPLNVSGRESKNEMGPNIGKERGAKEWINGDEGSGKGR
jgi:hypothetical protein